MQRRRKRRQLGRRGLVGVVILAVIVGLVFLLSSSGGKKAAAPTTSTSSTTTTSTFPTPTTQPFNTAAVAPTCPGPHETKRIVWFKAAPPSCISPSSVWDATFTTSVGSFTVKMDAASSFKAVNNFVFLARWNYYNGTFFHRVVTGFVDQGGDPAGSGTGEVAAKGKVPAHTLPGYQFTGNVPPLSCVKAKDCYPVGSFDLANSGEPSTDASQFFIVVPGGEAQLQPTPSASDPNPKPLYTELGQVTSGLGVVEKINSYGTQSGTGTPRVRVYVTKVVVTQVSS